MSRTIDEKVVSMQFDNKNFESNVSTTLSTLEKLKRSLNLNGAAKGLEGLGNAANKVDMSGLSTGVETVRTRFSALQVMGVTALANITNSAVNAGKRIAKALTLDPIKMGFNEYETKINAVQTIMSNTASKGTTMADVTNVLDELNTYADKTIYNFAEMTRNIGTFTAAGVGLKESASAIKGIANLAAASGSSSQQASTAMYQLSQALAAGTVKLMDWNSVVNAGMGGEKFQEALKATAREHGVAVDEIIKKNGSFRDSLQEGWLSADILNETLSKFTVDGAKKYAQSMMESGKWTKEQADALIKEAQSMEDAATKVKTFTQLMDTLKESLQSGWAKTWEILFGDFEEAKDLFTGISDALGGIINKSAESRNALLQGWKDMGGRNDLIESLENVFEGLGSIIKPIIEAFREIFPPTTSKQLYNFTAGLKELTAKLKVSDETAKKIKATFKGVFSILAFGIDIVKAVVVGALSLVGAFDGVQEGALGITAAIGTFITNLRDSIKEANIFGTAIDKIGSFFKNLISTIVNAVSDPKFFSVVNGGIFAGILIGINKFIKGFSNPLDKLSDIFENAGGVLENVTGIFDNVRECFVTYQNQLKADILMKIAGAIGVLAASLYVVSTIDPGRLVVSLGGMAVLMKELMWSLNTFNGTTFNLVGIGKAVTAMIGMSTAIVILSVALKRISTIDPVGIIKGLAGIGALMLELSIFLSKAKLDGKLTGTALGIVVLSTAMLILAKAMKNFGSMEWGEIGKGLTAIGALLTEITIFTRLTSGASKGIISTSTGLVILGVAMNTFASAMKKFGSMSWSEIGKGLTAMAGALVEVAVGMRMMPKNMIVIGSGLTIVAVAMNILSKSVDNFGSMSWSEIGRGLTVMAGSLIELAIALKMMNGSISGSAALIIASGALSILAPTLKTLGKMSWESIVKGLVSLAGAFTVIGIAGAVLSPLIPSILGLAGAFALLGIAMAGIGLGLAGIATGIATLATAVSGGAVGIVTGLTDIITAIAELIPTVLRNLGEGIVEFAKIIGNHAPVLAESLLKLISECLKSLSQYIPQMADSLLELFIGVLESIRDNIPRLVIVAMEIIGELFKAICDQLSKIDSKSLINAVKSLGLLTALIYGLSTISGMIPGAMVGVLGMGVVIAELSAVLAALGGLAQIPGLKWIISEGGNFLQAIGTAIGQFVGGIVGGAMKGITGSLPQIGKDLSKFMKNVQPFIEGAMFIDSSVVKGVKSLAQAVLIITAADILQGLTSWLTGGNSLAEFGEQLVPFGESMREYAETVSGIDSSAITASATAAKALSEVANNLPNSGGIISWFTGNNDFSTFGEQLEAFGKSMSAYSESISGINPTVIVASANAAQSLSELANGLPNTGGLMSWFSGNNDISTFGEQLIPFGKGMKSYSDSISGINPEAITASATAAKSLSELANGLPNTGGIMSWFSGNNDISTFGSQLVPFGKGLKSYSDSIVGINPETITASATAAQSLSTLANNLPNLGGLVSLFSGDQNLSTFGQQLIPFGSSLKSYSDSIAGINPEVITASATAAQSLAKLYEYLPSMGGVIEWFTGREDLATFGTQLAPFGKGLKEYANAIGDGINPEIVTASATAAMALAKLYDSLPSIGGVVEWFSGKKDLTSFGDQLAPFGKAIKKYAVALGDGINPEIVTASATIVSALAKLNNSLPSIGGVVDWFTGKKDLTSFGTQLEAFGKSLAKYVGSISEISEDGIAKVNTTTNAALALAKLYDVLPSIGGMVDWFTGQSDLSEFGTQLQSFGKSLAKYSNSIVDVNPEQVTKSASATKALAQVAKNMPDKDTWLSKGMSMETFGKSIVPFGDGLAKYSEKVASVNAEAISTSASAVKTLVSVVKSMNGIDTKGVTSFKTAINELAKTNISGVVKAFSGKTDSLSKVGSNLVSALTKGMTNKKSEMSKTATTLVNTMVKELESKKSKFNSAGVKLISELNTGLGKNSSKIKSTLSSMLSSVVTHIRSYYSKFNSAGSYLVSGFVSGINSNSYKATSAGKSLAKKAYDAAKKQLNINSPSRVFRSLGYSVVEGFAMGIDRMSRTSEASAVNMADSAIKSTSRAISRIADVINSDVDTQPTIRPVVDLTDVKSSAGTINSMFGMNPSIKTMATVGAINTMMNQNNQNGFGEEIVSAIDKLRKDLGNIVGGTTNYINGITYDDGSNVSDAVETLVRAAKIGRRM